MRSLKGPMAYYSHASIGPSRSELTSMVSTVLTSNVYAEIFVLVNVVPNPSVNVCALAARVVGAHEGASSGPVGVVQTSTDLVGFESVGSEVLSRVGAAVQPVIALVGDGAAVADGGATFGNAPLRVPGKK